MALDVQSGLRVSALGMAAGAVLASVKLVTGLVGNSYALVADAVESFADIVGSAVVWSGLTVSARPPDENHPYGHGKADPLAALAVGLMLLAAAVGIFVQAVREIVTPHHAPEPYTLVVLIGVVVVKEALFRFSSRIGGNLGSTAVLADAWHHRSDALTSLAAGAGIAVCLIGGPSYEAADDLAAILATGVIALNGVRFARRATAELMDVQPEAEFLVALTEAALVVKGVHTVEKVLARKMGTTYLVDMHIEVDATMSVREAHELAHCVKDEIRRRHRNVSDVLVHVEPFAREPQDVELQN